MEDILPKISPGMLRMIALLAAISFGAVVPVLFSETISFFDTESGFSKNLIPPLIMLMLLSSFVDVKFNRESTSWAHLRMLIFMPLVATILYFVIWKISGNQDFAIIAFLLGMTPTGNATPVICSLLKLRDDFGTVATVITNLYVAVILAPVTAAVLGNVVEIDTFSLAWKVCLLIGAPFLLAMIFRNFVVPAANFVRKYKFLSFHFWLTVVFIACAQCSAYIMKNEFLSLLSVAEVFLLSAFLCAVNFGSGYLLGGKKFRRECSQSLGQKNTMLMVWVGIAFFNPVVALGPTFYVICQNIWNSLQFQFGEKK